MKFKIVYVLGRIILLVLLMYHLYDLILPLDSQVTIPYFLKKGLQTIFSFNDGGAVFNFVKIVVVLTVFFVGYLSTVMFTADLTEGFAKVIKVYSGTGQYYLIKRVHLMLPSVGEDSTIWIVSTVILFFIRTGKIEDLWVIISFLGVNALACLLINLLVGNATVAFTSFTLLFLGQQLIVEQPVYAFMMMIGLIGLTITHWGVSIRGDES